jgi:hypothetical protein
MNYKYPPIYKYGLLLLTIYMFLKHQKIMSAEKLLTNSLLITLMLGVLDYILIAEHPAPFDSKHNSTEKESFDKLFDEDSEKIIESYDVSILDDLEEDNNDYDMLNININGAGPSHRYGNNHNSDPRNRYSGRQYYTTS